MSDPTPADLAEAAASLLSRCLAGQAMLALAESCTGGMVSTALTAIAGSSAVVERGFVTYSNAAKTELLGVPAALIETFGAVSAETARAMAEGALAHSHANLSLAITGIAGPGGGTPEKPVGTVHIAAAQKGGAVVHRHLALTGDRNAIRLAASIAALELASSLLG